MLAQRPRTHALANSLSGSLPCPPPLLDSCPVISIALSSRKPSLTAPSRAQLPGLGSCSHNSSFQPSPDPMGVGESVFAFAPQPGGLLSPASLSVGQCTVWHRNVYKQMMWTWTKYPQPPGTPFSFKRSSEYSFVPAQFRMLVASNLAVRSGRFRNFPDSPMVRTLCFHCRGPGFNPWPGN